MWARMCDHWGFPRGFGPGPGPMNWRFLRVRGFASGIELKKGHGPGAWAHKGPGTGLCARGLSFEPTLEKPLYWVATDSVATDAPDELLLHINCFWQKTPSPKTNFIRTVTKWCLQILHKNCNPHQKSNFNVPIENWKPKYFKNPRSCFCAIDNFVNLTLLCLKMRVWRSQFLTSEM